LYELKINESAGESGTMQMLESGSTATVDEVITNRLIDAQKVCWKSPFWLGKTSFS
jgi:hypothetical protein